MNEKGKNKGMFLKTTIEIPRLLMISIMLFVVSLLLIITKGYDLYNYNHPYDLNELNQTNMKQGKYVNCNIDSYLVKKISPSSYNGQSETFVTFGKEYNTYTIPMDEDDYIRIMIYNKNITETLESFSRGKGETVTVKGVLVNAESIGDDSWYKDIENFNINSVIQDFAIQEKTDEGIKNVLILGVMLLVLSVFLCWKSGGVKKNMKILLHNMDVRLEGEEIMR